MKRIYILALTLVLLVTALTPFGVGAAGEAVCTPALWQLDVDNTVDDGGMSYVIRLSDGTFVVIDGGYPTEAEAKNLYSVLYANNVLSGKPVIAAWFITHLHPDHYGALQEFTDLYLNDVTVNGFYYNFPTQQIGDIGPTNATSVENTMKKWTGATRHSDLKKGDSLTLAGATVDVLCTWEDVVALDSTVSDGNETSTVLRFNIEGQKLLFLADGEALVSQVLLNGYQSSELKSDIVQMAHHGFDDGATDELYEAVDADTLLWPMDITRYKDGVLTVGTTSDTKTYLNYFHKDHGQKTAYNAATDVYPAYQNQRLDLPYTPVGNKPSASATETKWSGLSREEVPNTAAVDFYTALANEIKAVKDAAKRMYVQISNNRDALRLVCVLNIAEENLKDFESFGFEITFQYGGKTYVHRVDAQTVYESVMANDKTYTAASLGGTYLYAVEITGLQEVQDELVFSVRGIGTKGAGSYTHSVAAYRYIYGAGISAEANGDTVKLNFSSLIGK